jgi:hypothetical protein
MYRWCIVTLIIAHVSPNFSLENVTFETRRVSLCIVTLIIARVSLNFMARISVMSRHDFWYGSVYMIRLFSLHVHLWLCRSFS